MRIAYSTNRKPNYNAARNVVEVTPLMKSCQICGVEGTIRHPQKSGFGTPLVRDHDHKTGYIRGALCQRCNSWLGILENHYDWYIKRLGRAKWRQWVRDYASEIYRHLRTNTGIRYVAARAYA